MKRRSEILMGYVISYYSLESDCFVYVKHDGLELSEIEVTGNYTEAIKFDSIEEAEKQLKLYIENCMIDMNCVKGKRLWIEELSCKSYIVDNYDFR